LVVGVGAKRKVGDFEGVSIGSRPVMREGEKSRLSEVAASTRDVNTTLYYPPNP
jgi:hypothetical protein